MVKPRKPRSYVDDDWHTHDRDTIEVPDEQPAGMVTYRGDEGERFSVIIRKRPNPIGFRAKLPGDKS